ncbi:aldehyde dehydrogenase family protein [Alphaproteobacteria bacterium HT1-32]|nr:aldehyde dehydrogenase family protein [Alphaproteobacteria bacterium HT1-32]
MTSIQKCISPVDGRVYVERPHADNAAIEQAIAGAAKAQAAWRLKSVAERAAICGAAVDAFVGRKSQIAEEITWQMGRPISQAPGEVGGFEERARHMIAIADTALADVQPAAKDGFNRFIRREAVGVVFTVAPWNFPYLTAVNSVWPAVMAGNAVLLKHSAQTPLCAERFEEAFVEAGAPEGLVRHLHLTHDQTASVMRSAGVDFVAFTGSVDGGHAVQHAVADRFIGTGLELGGKDPAYVRADADLAQAIDTLVDGAMFNTGQSCCGIERIYVHQSVFDDFLSGAAELIRGYRLGDPTDSTTNLGPMVRTSAADFVRGQVAEAVAAGATAHVDPKLFAADAAGTPYLAPQILSGVDHSMRVMTEESFGPVVGVMPVADDAEAIRLMNDSAFGLTASVFTRDEEAAIFIGNQVETGTFFMNRCDYLDPALAWTGVKNSGRGCTLSSVGYESLTRPKSYHLKRLGS